jgi:hypothetical protein
MRVAQKGARDAGEPHKPDDDDFPVTEIHPGIMPVRLGGERAMTSEPRLLRYARSEVAQCQTPGGT